MKPMPAETSAAVSTKKPHWHPLLVGDEAATFRAVVDDIAEALVPMAADEGTDRDRGSLSEGAPGLAVHFAFRHMLTGRARDRQRAHSYLEQAFAAAENDVMPVQFFSGLAGIGWAGQFVQDAMQDDEDHVVVLDEPLLSWVESRAPAGDYDLIRGVVGIGCYFLARLPRPSAVRGLTAIVAYLATNAEQRDEGTTWLTPPHVLGSDTRGISPHGHYDVGLAHGVAGVVAFLGKVVQTGVVGPQALEMLEGAVAWILAQERPEGRLRFPYWIALGERDKRNPRLAWCYGDLGVAAAVMNAARRVGRLDWEEQALDIARRITKATDAEACILDAGICHGTAGAAHIFNRFHQATGEEIFADAARHWFRHTIAVRSPGEAVAGFPSFFPAGDADDPWVPRRGLLLGAAGVGLSLAGAITDIEPVWDRHLLVDIPPSSDSGDAT